MPKFVSKLHRKEITSSHGKVTQGITAWIPQNDAAKACSISDKATELIDPETNKPYYIRKDPNERKNMEKKNKKQSVEWLKRRGKM